MSSRNPPTPATSKAMRRVLSLLASGDYSAVEISARAAVGVNTLTKGGWLRAMERQGLIHIARWQPPPTSGNWAPVWRLGAGQSAPKPPRAGNTVTARRWRHKTGNEQRKAARKPRVESRKAAQQVRRQITRKATPDRLSLAGLLGL